MVLLANKIKWERKEKAVREEMTKLLLNTDDLFLCRILKSQMKNTLELLRVH